MPLAVRSASLVDILVRARVRDEEPPVPVDDAVAVVESFEAAMRVLPRGTGTCLTRSLWRCIALRRAGIPIHFVLGVRLDEARRPQAHAWLELHGAPFLERRPENLQHFSRIFADPPLPGQGTHSPHDVTELARAAS